MARHSCEVSVVIPAYNESERIGRTLQVTAACLRREIESFEIIVVDDGSRDKTGEAAGEAIQRLRLGKLARVISYSPNQGKGWALRQGAEAAQGRYVAFFDADLDISPRHIPAYLAVLRTEKADAVVASKRHPESSLEYARSRVLISNIYYWFNRIFFGLDIKDTQSGMKLFRREVLDRAMPRLLGKRFAFDLELLVTIRRDGGKIVEQPVTIENHDKFGRIGLLSLWHAFVDTLAIFYRVYLQRFYDRTVVPGHAAGRKAEPPRIAVCVFSDGYGKRIEAFCRHLNDTMESMPELVILAPKDDFRIPGALVLACDGLSVGQAALLAAGRVQSDALYFLDEDCRPGRGLLKRLAGYLASGEVDAVTGPFELVQRQPVAQRLAMRVLRHPLMTIHPFSRFNLSRQRMTDRAWIISLCVRRQVLRRDTMTVMEDQAKPWLVWEDRFYAASRAILYTPDAVVARHVPGLVRPLMRSLWLAGLQRGQRMASGGLPVHLVRLREYLPVFILIALLIGSAFSLFSVHFWNWWRWLFFFWLALSLAGSGYVFRVYKAVAVAAGVISGTVVCGAGFLRGLFGGKRPEDG